MPPYFDVDVHVKVMSSQITQNPRSKWSGIGAHIKMKVLIYQWHLCKRDVLIDGCNLSWGIKRYQNIAFRIILCIYLIL
jgi:hypothetical protein